MNPRPSTREIILRCAVWFWSPTLVTLIGLWLLAACALTPAQEANVTKVITTVATDAQTAVRVLCVIQVSAGALVAGVVDATATAVAPDVAPAVVVLVGATKAVLDAACHAMGGFPSPVPVVGTVTAP